MNFFQLGWKCYTNFWTKEGYANFKGRVTRKEYWSTLLIFFLLSIVVSLISNISRVDISFLWAGAHIIPWNCFLTRRLHDSNKSGIIVIVYNILSYFGLFALFQTLSVFLLFWSKTFGHGWSHI